MNNVMNDTVLDAIVDNTVINSDGNVINGISMTKLKSVLKSHGYITSNANITTIVENSDFTSSWGYTTRKGKNGLVRGSMCNYVTV